MATVPVVRALSSMPSSIAGASTWANRGLAANAIAGPSSQVASLFMAAASALRRHDRGIQLDLVALRHVLRQQLALPLGDRGGGDGVADGVGRRAAHVEERIDAEDEEQSRFRDVELRECR